jgi:hypothetical protein
MIADSEGNVGGARRVVRGRSSATALGVRGRFTIWIASILLPRRHCLEAT